MINRHSMIIARYILRPANAQPGRQPPAEVDLGHVLPVQHRRFPNLGGYIGGVEALDPDWYIDDGVDYSDEDEEYRRVGG